MRLSIMQKSSDRSRAEDFFALLHFCLRAFADQALFFMGRIFFSIKGAHVGEHNIIQIICRAFLIPTQQCLHKTGEPAASALRTIDDGWIRIFADSDIFR